MPASRVSEKPHHPLGNHSAKMSTDSVRPLHFSTARRRGRRNLGCGCEAVTVKNARRGKGSRWGRSSVPFQQGGDAGAGLAVGSGTARESGRSEEVLYEDRWGLIGMSGDRSGRRMWRAVYVSGSAPPPQRGVLNWSPLSSSLSTVPPRPSLSPKLVSTIRVVMAWRSNFGHPIIMVASEVSWVDPLHASLPIGALGG